MNVNVYENVLVSVFACVLVFVFVGYGVCEHWCVRVFGCLYVPVFVHGQVWVCACVPVCIDVRVSVSVDVYAMLHFLSLAHTIARI